MNGPVNMQALQQAMQAAQGGQGAMPQGGGQAPQNAALFAALANRMQGAGAGGAPMPPMAGGINAGGMPGTAAGQPPVSMQPQMGGPMQPQVQGPAMNGAMPQLPPRNVPILSQGGGAGMQGSGLQGGGAPGPAQMMPQGGVQPGQRFNPQEMAALGRMGDKVVAHMTPGEISVPPQVQTPRVLATLKNAFQDKGADPSKFVAGSPNSSINPNTGMPEYSFFSSMLPMALSIAGGLAMPGIGAGLGLGLSDLAAGAIGSGLGSTIGGLIGGQDPLKALLTGAGSGIGGYALGSAFDGAGAAADATKGAAAAGSSAPANAAATGATSGASITPAAQVAQDVVNEGGMGGVLANAGAPAAATTAADNSGLFGNLLSKQNIASTIGGSLGGSIGASLYTPPAQNNTRPTNGSYASFPDVSTLPSFQQQLGQNTYSGPTPNFTNYNPLAPNATSYNFFPR